ncbi:MAG: DUF4058 family protein [Isosphaerales bacterium]
MPSPFPGIDPFLEDQHYWEEFHSKFMNWTQDTLAEWVPDAYEVRIEERVSLTYEEDPDFKRTLQPNVAVLRQTGVGSAAVSAANALTLMPVSLSLPMYQLEEVIEHRIEIRRRPDRFPVAVIELLSPSNKEPPGDRLYSRKRLELIHQAVHLVELDFLIGGKRLAMEDELPAGDYYALVSRAEQRPRSDVYAWSIRDPLPTIPIPLLAPDPDIPLDLAAIFATVFQRGRYNRSIHYSAPLGLARGPADRTWAAELARAFEPEATE